MNDNNLIDFLRNMPKVELHIHLEGSIPVATLWELIKKYNGTDEVRNIDELKKKFEYTDFPHFIETWVWKNRFLNEYEDFEFIAAHAAENLAKQNIKYVEMFYSPPDFMNKNLDPKRITESVCKGISKHSDRIRINLVADLVRDFGPQEALRNLRQINEVKQYNVIGIGIGGSEHAFPPGQFKDVYEAARNMGFHTSVHAGEAAGPESIWGALKELKAERIGHGTRAIEDPALVEYLKSNSVPIEMCPISNVMTGVVTEIKKHPVKNLYQLGLNVFVNTDDPEMFHNTMVDEYHTCVKNLDFSINDIKQLALNAINAAWCSQTMKQSLRTEINNYFKSNNYQYDGFKTSRI